MAIKKSVTLTLGSRWAFFNALKAPSIGSVPIDFATFTIPILMVWPHHNMSLGKKIRIIALLSTGGVASIFSVWRMVQLIDYADTTDPTMALVYVNIAE